MTILRIKKRDNPFVQIDHRPLTDESLSWKAKGLLAYLLTKPDHWETRVTDLVRRGADGESAVRSGLDELITAGYIERTQERRSDGTYAPTEYIVHELPITSPHSDYPHADKPHVENHLDSNKYSSNSRYASDETTPEEPTPQPPSEPTKKAAPEPTNGKTANPKAMFSALAKLCGIDLRVLTSAQRGLLNQTESILRNEARAGPHDLAAFGEWWHTNDWRGKKGDVPRPQQVREEWAKFCGQAKSEPARVRGL